jgi:ABC-type transport system involved in cytochrome bd biosynthesis fused ATPase/permease subunit
MQLISHWKNNKRSFCIRLLLAIVSIPVVLFLSTYLTNLAEIMAFRSSGYFISEAAEHPYILMVCTGVYISLLLWLCILLVTKPRKGH